VHEERSVEHLKAESHTALTKVKKIIQGGGIIAYPTETFYGLGVDARNEEAVKALFSLKGRDFNKPVSILVKDETALRQVVTDVPPAAEALIRHFWPGPLTLVFTALPALSPLLTAGTGKIGVRISSSPTAAELLAAIDCPLTTTSANPSGLPAPVTAEAVLEYFGDGLDALLDGGELPGTLGSTVVDVTGANVTILREGEIAAEAVVAASRQSRSRS